MTRRKLPAPTQARSRATHETILAAATTLLEEKGPDALAMREVARAAGVSTGTLYQYFANRESLLHAIEGRSWQALLERIQAKVLEWPELGAFERTVRVVELAITDIVHGKAKHGMTAVDQVPEQTLAQRKAFVEWMGAALPGLCERAGVRLLPAEGSLAASLVIQMVMHLARVGQTINPEELASGTYAREVGRVVARYLLGTEVEAREAAEAEGKGEPHAPRPPSNAKASDGSDSEIP